MPVENQMPQLPEQISSLRLMLRPAYQADAQEHFGLIKESKEELAKAFLWVQGHNTVEDSHQVVAKFKQEWDKGCYHYSIYLKDNTLIGQISWFGNTREPWQSELGFWLGGTYTGQGYMAEALSTLTATAFSKGAKRATIRCVPSNTASANVAKRAGFIYEGLLRQDTLEDDGTFSDSLQYSRLASDPKPS